MADRDDQDQLIIIQHLVDDPVLTGPNSKHVLDAGQLLAAGRPRIVGECIETPGDALLTSRFSFRIWRSADGFSRTS
jgi:hypothetical protein